jgi:type IV secretory pathway VirJ component
VIRAFVIGLAGFLVSTGAYAAPESITFGRFGTVPVYRPSAEPVAAAVLLSSEDGWRSEETTLAEALAQKGTIVFGVDWRKFAASLEREKGACVYPAADLATLAQFGEKQLGVKQFLLPVLIGRGDGAAATYPIFAQPPADTFKAALAIGFRPQLALSKLLCKGHQPALLGTASAGGTVYPPIPAGLPGFVALTRMTDKPADLAAIAERLAATPGTTLTSFAGPDDELAKALAAFDIVASKETDFEKAQMSGDGTGNVAPADPAAARAGHVDVSGLSDLPLTVVQTPSDPKSFAIFLSGDGGWAGIDQSIAAALASKGIESIGFNTLDYFWNERKPAETAADLDRVLAAIAKAAPDARVIIIGYSYGGEIAPVAFPLLSSPSKAMIDRLVLMVPGLRTSFAFSTGYWLGIEPSDGFDVEKAIRAAAAPTMCIMSNDDDGACAALKESKPAFVTVKTLGNGHHFGGDYDTLAGLITNPL